MLRRLYPFLFFINVLLFIIHISDALLIGVSSLNILFIMQFLSKCKKTDLIYLKWVAYFFLFCSFSCLWALNTNVALWVILQQQIPIYFLCISMFMYVRNRGDLLKCFKSFYYASIVLLIYVIINVDIASLAGSRLSDTNDEQLWNPNYLGLHLTLGLYAGYFAVYKKFSAHFVEMLIYIIVAIGMIAVILLSGSRAALISLITPLLIKIFFNNKNFLKSSLLISCILILCFILTMRVPVLYSNIGIRIEEMYNILSGSGTGDESRLVLIMSGLLWFQEAPILGIGINNFRILSGARLHYSTPFYAHNNYVELLVDIGIIGFIVYYITYFLLLSKSKILNRTQKSWFLGFMMMMLLSDMTHVSYYEISLQLLMCTLYIVLRVEKLNKYNYPSKVYENNRYYSSR